MLEQADKTEDLAEFITYIAHCCEHTLNLHLKAARGEDIEDVEDIDKEIVLFKRSLQKDTTDNTIQCEGVCGQGVVSIIFLLPREDRTVFRSIRKYSYVW